jgi:hypothetical protein
MRNDFHFGENGLSGRRFRVAVAALCLALLAMLAFAQATHFHSNQTDADHCQLCIAMHSAAPVGATTAAIVMVDFGVSAPQPEPTFVLRQRISSLFIRPPPVSC